MERINERMYQANIELVDRNKILEKDFKELQKKVRLVIELVENLQIEKKTKGVFVDGRDILYVLKGSGNIESINS